MTQFIDEATIKVRSGNGGKGCVSFRREKYVPRGGPNGGDGGWGGHVVFVANENMTSLLDYRYKKEYKAKNGEHGKGKNQHGKNAPDLRIPVPVGTVIKNLNNKEVIGDLITKDEKLVVAKGGKGGRGNARFVSSTNQVPQNAEPGQEGSEIELLLELKLLADVGIIGFPNAGKSTLISKISASKAKIDDYPFTTLVPNLGVVRYDDFKTFVVADIPGIIEGAHKGVGLGIKFLKHVERTIILIHLLDLSPSTNRDPIEDYSVLNNELKSYSTILAEKPQLIVLNKIDITEARSKALEIEKHFKSRNLEVLKISSATGEGTQDLVHQIRDRLLESKSDK